MPEIQKHKNKIDYQLKDKSLSAGAAAILNLDDMISQKVNVENNITAALEHALKFLDKRSIFLTIEQRRY
jgi:dihydropteroate synthase